MIKNLSPPQHGQAIISPAYAAQDVICRIDFFQTAFTSLHLQAL